MSKFTRKFDFAKNKFSGDVKETVGKMTDNEQLELKGKVQSLQAETQYNLDNKIEQTKEDIAAKINKKMEAKK